MPNPTIITDNDTTSATNITTTQRRFKLRTATQNYIFKALDIANIVTIFTSIPRNCETRLMPDHNLMHLAHGDVQSNILESREQIIVILFLTIFRTSKYEVFIA